MRTARKVGGRCLTCAHPERAAIDKSLLDGSVSINRLSKSYALDRQSMARHKTNHVLGGKSKAEKLVAKSAAQVAIEQEAASSFVRTDFKKPEDVLASMTNLYNEQWRMYLESRAIKDMRMMSKSLAECAVLAEKLAKAFGVFAADGQTTINITANAGMRKIEDIIDSMSTDELRAYLASVSDAKRESRIQKHVSIYSPHGPALPTAETIDHDDDT